MNQNLQIPQAVTGISVGNRMNHKDIGYAQNVLDVPGKDRSQCMVLFRVVQFRKWMMAKSNIITLYYFPM